MCFKRHNASYPASHSWRSTAAKKAKPQNGFKRFISDQEPLRSTSNFYVHSDEPGVSIKASYHWYTAPYRHVPIHDVPTPIGPLTTAYLVYKLSCLGFIFRPLLRAQAQAAYSISYQNPSRSNLNGKILLKGSSKRVLLTELGCLMWRIYHGRRCFLFDPKKTSFFP